MDKEVRFILHDLTDVVEELTKIVRVLDPGANMGLVDFLLARIDRSVSQALDAAERAS
jgi:hypothetical protein